MTIDRSPTRALVAIVVASVPVWLLVSHTYLPQDVALGVTATALLLGLAVALSAPWPWLPIETAGVCAVLTVRFVANYGYLLVALAGTIGSVALAVIAIRPPTDSPSVKPSWRPWLAVAVPFPYGIAAMTQVAGPRGLVNLTIFCFGLIVAAFAGTGAVRVGEPRARASTWPILVPLGASAVAGGLSGRLIVPTALVALALALTGVAWWMPRSWGRVFSPRGLTPAVDASIARTDRVLAGAGRLVAAVARAVDRGIRATARGIARLVSLPMLTLVWLVMVGVPWALTRVLGIDPLAPPRSKTSRWLPASRTDLRPDAAWALDSAPASTRRRGLPWTRSVPLAAIAVIILVNTVTQSTPPPTPFTTSADQTSVAMQSVFAEPWYPEFGNAMSRLQSKQIVQSWAGLEPPDIKSRNLNSAGGWRKTWQPPAPPCSARLVVWTFGGSTTWGESQRDDYTISSELAKIAWSRGITLEIRNGGVHADVAWQEERRMERALANEREAPDLVVFYDGFNDYMAQKFAQLGGTGGLGTMMDQDESLLELITHLQLVTKEGKSHYEAPLPESPPRRLNNAVIVPAALRQYAVADHEAHVVLDERGIAMVRAFQPSLGTRNPRDPDDPALLEGMSDAMHRMRSGLPADVIDLGGVLDHVPGPIYTDNVHTPESANPVIATALLDSIQPVISRLTPHSPSSCT